MFRKLVKRLMRQKGMSTPELIAKSRTGTAVVYEFLRGKRNIRSDNLERILKALEWKPEVPNKSNQKS